MQHLVIPVAIALPMLQISPHGEHTFTSGILSIIESSDVEDVVLILDHSEHAVDAQHVSQLMHNRTIRWFVFDNLHQGDFEQKFTKKKKKSGLLFKMKSSTVDFREIHHAHRTLHVVLADENRINYVLWTAVQVFRHQPYWFQDHFIFALPDAHSPVCPETVAQSAGDRGVGARAGRR